MRRWKNVGTSTLLCTGSQRHQKVHPTALAYQQAPFPIPRMCGSVVLSPVSANFLILRGWFFGTTRPSANCAATTDVNHAMLADVIWIQAGPFRCGSTTNGTVSTPSIGHSISSVSGTVAMARWNRGFFQNLYRASAACLDRRWCASPRGSRTGSRRIPPSPSVALLK